MKIYKLRILRTFYDISSLPFEYDFEVYGSIYDVKKFKKKWEHNYNSPDRKKRLNDTLDQYKKMIIFFHDFAHRNHNCECSIFYNKMEPEVRYELWDGDIDKNDDYFSQCLSKKVINDWIIEFADVKGKYPKNSINLKNYSQRALLKTNVIQFNFREIGLGSSKMSAMLPWILLLK